MSTYNSYIPQMGMGLGMGAGLVSMNNLMMYQPSMPTQSSLSFQQPNWEAEFSRVSESDVKGKGKARIVEVSDDAGFEEAFKNLEVSDKEESRGELDDYMASFEK